MSKERSPLGVRNGITNNATSGSIEFGQTINSTKSQLRQIFSRIENLITQHKDQGQLLEDCLEDIRDIYEKEKLKGYSKG